MIKNRAARRKLLRILTRNDLETLCDLDRPHMATRSELITACEQQWRHEDVCYLINKILRSAK
jgi:hypothetical protein